MSRRIAPEGPGVKVVAVNRRARHDYEIMESFEAGLALLGSEVKSLRAGRADLKDGYGSIEGGQAWLIGVHISPYQFAREGGHEPERARKLLLHRGEIERIRGKLDQKGLTLIPLRLYFKAGKAKVEVALARGKARYDKRETLKRRQAEREMQRAMRHKSID
ncbi:MAG: SsrA-binding protein SmpB [Actinobacteria bacterium]|nr:SsrA-binding protein SmpB [Actinomycetota bacterium]